MINSTTKTEKFTPLYRQELGNSIHIPEYIGNSNALETTFTSVTKRIQVCLYINITHITHITHIKHYRNYKKPFMKTTFK